MFYIYRIINNINGHDYVGKRKCPANKTPEEDGYLGSGMKIVAARAKYGNENFSKEILARDIEDEEEANLLEKKFIKESKEQGRAYYNIANGGDGGNTFRYMSPEKLQEHKNRQRQRSLAYFATETSEQRHERISKAQETRAHWSSKKKEEVYEAIARAKHLSYVNASPERKLEISENRKKLWQEMSSEKKEEIRQSVCKGRRAHEEKLTKEQKAARLENLLQKLGKEYVIQKPDGEIIQGRGLTNFVKKEFGDKWGSARNSFDSLGKYKGYILLSRSATN